MLFSGGMTSDYLFSAYCKGKLIDLSVATSKVVIFTEMGKDVGNGEMNYGCTG
jgi:hypothetical protein